MSAGTHSTSITTMLFLSIDSLNYEGVLTNVTNIVLRTTTVYIVVLAGLRLLGKHHVAQLSIIDLVLILLISNAVQNADGVAEVKNAVMEVDGRVSVVPRSDGDEKHIETFKYRQTQY